VVKLQGIDNCNLLYLCNLRNLRLNPFRLLGLNRGLPRLNRRQFSPRAAILGQKHCRPEKAGDGELSDHEIWGALSPRKKRSSRRFKRNGYCT
jgi:hypothetical protein